MLPRESGDFSQIGLTPPSPEPAGDWVHSHPYTAIIGSSCVLLIAGALIVMSRSSVAPASRPEAWGNNDVTLLNPTSYKPEQRLAPDVPPSSQQNTPDKVIPVYKPQEQGGGPAQNDLELNSLLALLTKPAGTQKGAAGGGSSVSAYAFIPTGLISTTSYQKQRSDAEQRLYEYGNEVGSYIQSYEQANRNQAQVLTDQMQDRQDKLKAQSVKNVGTALKNVGLSMQGIEDVPAIARSAHAALAKSYIEIGENLIKVPDAESDQQLLAAIGTYNASAETFAKRYAALAVIFSAASVTFADDDAGSVFMFTMSNSF